MDSVVISGTGLYTPTESISNDELVASLNQYVQNYNQQHAEQIAAGEVEALLESSSAFIVKASGIDSRHVINKAGTLDNNMMQPSIRQRPDDQPSLMCELAVVAAKQAMQNAHKTAADIDMVIVACTNMERPYPAMAIEVQEALGIEGYGFDMNVACSSATFGIQTAAANITNGNARCVLMVNPELCTAQINFTSRDSHFIFGDACTAVIIEGAETCTAEHAYEIIGTKLLTKYSNNIRCNFGFLNRLDPDFDADTAELFVQEGRKVFKDVVPLVVGVINQQLDEHGIKADQLKRLWLHQANINMNRLVATKVMGYEPDETIAPVVLNEYANTGSAGSIIAFHKYHQDLNSGDLGLLCSFGAGYSIGSIILRKT